MRLYILGLFSLLATWPGIGYGDEQLPVTVLDPYLEMHTGPGRGYPIFYVIPRGETILIKFRQTDWFKIQTPEGKEGWVNRDQIVMTLDAEGNRLVIKDAGEQEFSVRRWEYGVMGGNLDGATVLNLNATYHFTENISTEIGISKAISSSASSTFLGASLVQQPFPDWHISPFFLLGTGLKQTQPKATLVQARDRTDVYANIGIGARMHFTKRFLLRIEYRQYVVFASRDDNEELSEWKAGFGFFF